MCAEYNDTLLIIEYCLRPTTAVSLEQVNCEIAFVMPASGDYRLYL
jgi:hypothetical protein